MKILAVEREVKGKKSPGFEKHLKSEALKVWQLCQKEIIREIYFEKKKNTAVLILECRNQQEAKKFLNELPLVKEKLITFEIFTLIPYNGFERLFKI
jgi:hypothetical protein